MLVAESAVKEGGVANGGNMSDDARGSERTNAFRNEPELSPTY